MSCQELLRVASKVTICCGGLGSPPSKLSVSSMVFCLTAVVPGTFLTCPVKSRPSAALLDCCHCFCCWLFWLLHDHPGMNSAMRRKTDRRDQVTCRHLREQQQQLVQQQQQQLQVQALHLVLQAVVLPPVVMQCSMQGLRWFHSTSSRSSMTKQQLQLAMPATVQLGALS